MLLNTSRREEAAGCKEEGNRLTVAGRFRLDAFGFISRNSIPIIGRLWRPPPIRLRRTPPYAGGRIGCSTLLLVSCSAKLSTHSPTSEAGGKVVASATKGGPPPTGGIYTGAARRPPPQRHGQPTKRKALLWAGYGPTSADLEVLCRTSTVLYNSLGRPSNCL